MPKLNNIKVGLNLGVFKVEGTWDPNVDERRAAWELYVELVTRISIAPLGPEEGLLREALSSLYSLFGSTREILRKYGPSVAKPKRRGNISFGFVAISMLNGVLRPTLAKWHPLLQTYEQTRRESVSLQEHEAAWEHIDNLRQAIEETRLTLIEYANLFALSADVPPLGMNVEATDQDT